MSPEQRQQTAARTRELIEDMEKPAFVLSQPAELPCGGKLPNRFAKAAMTEQMADPATNAPNDAIIRLYERWASSGAGMLLTGNVMIDRVCMENARNVAVEDERDLEMLRRWADAAQSQGAHLRITFEAGFKLVEVARA